MAATPANFFRTFLRILLWIAALPVALVVFILLSWQLRPDEPLDAETQRLLNYSQQVPAAANQYFAIDGFSASPELDPHRVGQQIAAGFAEWLKTKRGVKETFDPSPFLGATPMKSPKFANPPCRPESKACLAELRARQAELEDWSIRYAPYIARYRGLRIYPAFAEPTNLSIDTVFPRWAEMIFVSDLVNAQIAFDSAKPERRSAALLELAAEIAFWRKLADNSEMLITKMIASSALSHKYRLASELLVAYPEVASIHKQTVAAITAPLPPQWASMNRVMDSEFRFAASAHRDLERNMLAFLDEGSSAAWLVSALPVKLNAYRMNASINAQRRQYSRIGRFLSQPALFIVEKQREFDKEMDVVSPWSPSTILYNPVGKILTGLYSPSWPDYAFRLHDLVGYSRFLEAQRQLILARGQPVEAAKALLDNPRLADPYTEQPMGWDATTGELKFVARGKKLGQAGGVTVKIPQ